MYLTEELKRPAGFVMLYLIKSKKKIRKICKPQMDCDFKLFYYKPIIIITYHYLKDLNKFMWPVTLSNAINLANIQRKTNTSLAICLNRY